MIFESESGAFVKLGVAARTVGWALVLRYWGIIIHTPESAKLLRRLNT